VGFGFLFLVYAAASYFHLDTVVWLVTNSWLVLLIALVVLFQPDLRRMLNRVMHGGWWGGNFRNERVVFQHVTQAVRDLRKAGHGALVVLERNEPLDAILETGTKTGRRGVDELLVSILCRGRPCTTGGVLRNGRIIAAGCILPLSQNPNLSRS
jgi:diadenylate cyclase